VTEPGTNYGGHARWRLAIAVERRDGELSIAVSGRLGAASAPDLVSVLSDAVAAGDRRIVLNLNELDYISSAGVMALETTAARLRTEGRELILHSPTPPVRLALVLAGFPDDVPIEGPLITD
jgi:anti-sigma B factor antagonist